MTPPDPRPADEDAAREAAIRQLVADLRAADHALKAQVEDASQPFPWAAVSEWSARLSTDWPRLCEGAEWLLARLAAERARADRAEAVCRMLQRLDGEYVDCIPRAIRGALEEWAAAAPDRPAGEGKAAP